LAVAGAGFGLDVFPGALARFGVGYFAGLVEDIPLGSL
jgi:hypothetical protein